MSDINLTDWLTFVPAAGIRKQKAFIDLPAFSYTSQGTIGDASVIVAQFNFSASRDFYLLTRPTKPVGVNYGLCIRYRVGDVVTRYKLWEDPAFVLSSATPSLAKQLIKKNFVLEVWNFAGVTSSNTAALRMITSVRSNPTDFRTIADYALAIGAEFTALGSIAPTLPAGATHRWTNLGTSAGLIDTIGGHFLIETGPDISAVTFVPPDATWLHGRAKFLSSSNILVGSKLPGTYIDFTAYMVFNVTPLDINMFRYILNMGTNSSSSNFFVNKMGNTNKIRCGGDPGAYDLIISDTTPKIEVMTKALDFVFGNLDGDVSGATTTTAASITSPYLTVGGLNAQASAGEFNVAEVLLFRGLSIGPNSALDLQVKKYLRWYHFGEIPLPLTFNSGGAWLDNL